MLNFTSRHQIREFHYAAALEARSFCFLILIHKSCHKLKLGVIPVCVLTDDLDDFSQQHSVRHVGLEVLDQTLVSRLGKVVVGPVRVDLQPDANAGFQSQTGKKHTSKTGATPREGRPRAPNSINTQKNTKAVNECGKFTTNKVRGWLNGSGGALRLLLGLRSGTDPRAIQTGAIVLRRGIHLGTPGGSFQWAVLTSLSGDRKEPCLPGGADGGGSRASI